MALDAGPFMRLGTRGSQSCNSMALRVTIRRLPSLALSRGGPRRR